MTCLKMIVSFHYWGKWFSLLISLLLANLLCRLVGPQVQSGYKCDDNNNNDESCDPLRKGEKRRKEGS